MFNVCVCWRLLAYLRACVADMLGGKGLITHKEKHFHHYIFITGMCLSSYSISVPIASTKLLMVFDCEDQLSFNIYAMALPLKRLYKGMSFRITE